jgi:hypothetical protein
MTDISKVLFGTLALCATAPAAAQYYPPPPPPPGPPPGYYQPPPPPSPPPGWYGPQVRNNTLRLSGGMALASTGYYCGYGPGFVYPTCGAGYSPVLPNFNVDLDLGISRISAISIGANVMWGSFDGINTTIWEPHVDYLLRWNPFGPTRGRFRIGGGVYIASVKRCASGAASRCSPTPPSASASTSSTRSVA